MRGVTCDKTTDVLTRPPSRHILFTRKHITLSSRRGICFGAHNLLGAVDQTEDIVEHEVASGTIGLQLEALGVVHGLLLLIDLLVEKLISQENRRSHRHSTYQEGTGNQHNNAISAGGLGIEGSNLVLNLLEGQSLESQKSVSIEIFFCYSFGIDER